MQCSVWAGWPQEPWKVEYNIYKNSQPATKKNTNQMMILPQGGFSNGH